MKLIVLAPLVALALAGGSAGAYFWLSSEGRVEEATIAQATPTPAPAAEALPTATPTPTPALTPTPTPAPEEGGKAPKGCLAGELAYVDPDGRFAFCYPTDMGLFTVDTGEGIAVTVMHPLGQENRVVVNFGLSAQLRSITGAPCIDSPLLIMNRRIEDFFIAGRTVQACFQDHFDVDEAGNPTAVVHKTIEMEVPVATGFVHVDAASTGPDFQRLGVPLQDIVLRILDSAAIS